MSKLNYISGRVLFCNIAYMKYYKGITDKDKPINGGAYVKENDDAMEKYNFKPREDGMVHGFVETKHSKGYKNGADKPNKLHIERLDKNFKKKDSIDGVLVIFCAKKSPKSKTVVVGWYENATVYRNRFLIEVGENEYNIETLIENAHLIEENKRENFEIPRCKSKQDTGLGQSNVWYADKEKDVEFKEKAINYILSLKNGYEIEKEITEIEDIEKNQKVLSESEKEVIIKARIGQGYFRDKLIKRDKCCKLCGLSNKKLLIASHIKAWKKCENNSEKYDSDNGLLLCSIHDALFDKGLISFNQEGKIIISPTLSEKDVEILNIDKSLSINMSEKMKSYMKWHLENCFVI